MTTLSTVNDSCDSNEPTTPPLDPSIAGISNRYFTSIQEEAFRCVRPVERDILAIPWGPRVDVIFDPKNAAGILGGRVRLMARTAQTEVEIANVPITSAALPVTLSGSMGCEQYVVKAALGSDPGSSAKRVESYVFARVYSNR